jgi:hypothetical protein
MIYNFYVFEYMLQWEGSGIRCEKQIILLRKANIQVYLHKPVFTVPINGYADSRKPTFHNCEKKCVHDFSD